VRELCLDVLSGDERQLPGYQCARQRCGLGKRVRRLVRSSGVGALMSLKGRGDLAEVALNFD